MDNFMINKGFLCFDEILNFDILKNSKKHNNPMTFHKFEGFEPSNFIKIIIIKLPFKVPCVTVRQDFNNKNQRDKKLLRCDTLPIEPNF
jgi:hypothetical protein